jgi:adenylate cyclase
MPRPLFAAPFLARASRLRIVLPGLAALLAVLALSLLTPAALERIGHQFFDAWQRAEPRARVDAPVTVVEIDEESLRRVGQWPWPRTEIAGLIERLGSAGAAVVALDMVFSEPDRTSPARVASGLRRQGVAPGLVAGLSALPDNDAVLADAVGRNPVVTGYFLTRDPVRTRQTPKGGIAYSGSAPNAALASFSNAVTSLPPLEAAATGSGFLTFAPDADGIVRRATLLARQGETVLPALSLEALRVAQQAGSIVVKTSDGSGNLSGGSDTGVVAVKAGDRTVPTNRAGEIWLKYPAEGSTPRVPAWKLLAGALPAAEAERLFAGRLVFVGASAVGLRDLVATPVRDRELGVMVHAQAAEQMLTGHFRERPDWAPGLETSLVLLAGGLLLGLLPLLGALRGAVLGLVLAGGMVGGSWAAFTQAHYLLDPSWPLAAVLVIYLVETASTYFREERRRSYIHRAFDHYLSPELVRRIAADPKRLELGGEERETSVMFADIRNFSSLSESLEPQEITRFLIGYLTPMCDVLLASGATIDKFIGDGIVAFWNAPLDDPDHCEHAARAALAMIDRLERLNAEMRTREDQPWPGEVRIGIGLNAGPCCVGNIGSAQRLSYSLIGDAVNLSSRLEGLTKLYKVPIVISAAFREQTSQFAALPLDLVRVAGRASLDEVWALLGDEHLAADPDFRRFGEDHGAMLAAFRARDWAEAERRLDALGPLYARFRTSALQALYRKRIVVFQAAPPPDDWDGGFSPGKPETMRA